MSSSKSHEVTDEEPAKFGYGKGGVPWYLMLYYLAFLSLFTWYVLEYQLPGFIEHSPMGQPPGVEAPTE